jgi:hypothetical protein
MSRGHIRQRGKHWEIKLDLDRDPVTGNAGSRTTASAAAGARRKPSLPN